MFNNFIHKFIRKWFLIAACTFMILKLFINLVLYIEPTAKLIDEKAKNIQELYSIKKYHNTQIVRLTTSKINEFGFRYEFELKFNSLDENQKVFNFYDKQLKDRGWILYNKEAYHNYKNDNFPGMKFRVLYEPEKFYGSYGITIGDDYNYYLENIKNNEKFYYTSFQRSVVGYK